MKTTSIELDSQCSTSTHQSVLTPFWTSFFYRKLQPHNRQIAQYISWSQSYFTSLHISKYILQTFTPGMNHTWKFNTTSNFCSYLALFLSKTSSMVWYFIVDLILSNFHDFLALFKLKSIVIFVCFHYLIIFFKLCKITQTLHGVLLWLPPHIYSIVYRI